MAAFLGNAQVARNNGNVQTATSPATNPANISQFEVSGRLITQNAFVGLGAVPTAQQTGNFGPTARWNSMGSLNAGTQILNGFRTQTDGRGLTTGYSLTGGVLSNPTIQWIGNDAIGANVTPGSLEFKYARNPGSPGSPQIDVKIFTMRPDTTGGIPAFCFADSNVFVGQKQSGIFGRFAKEDIWSATGQISIPSFTTYGTRHQYKGYTLANGLFENNSNNTTNAYIDFGANPNAASNEANLLIRRFNDPNIPNTVETIMTFGAKFKNVIVSRRDVNTIPSSTNNCNFGVFDGPTANASNTASNFINGAGIYATTDGRFDDTTTIQNYGAVVGDVSLAIDSTLRVAVLGITNRNYTGGASNSGANVFAGYFIGRLGYTGSLIAVSDMRYKKNIKDEESIMSKIMQLAPKNYFFDYEKNKNMALSDQLQHGIVSQEVEKIFPELVEDAYAPSTTGNPKTDGAPQAYKGLNYIGLIPILTKAIQEQQIQIDALKKQVANMQSTETFVVSNATNTTIQEQELLTNKAYMLAQNVPNPFTQSTTIKYSLPNATNKAVIVILNLTGTLIQQYNLPIVKGNNQITVQAGSLAAGKYIYSLLVNGTEVISKTMLLTR